MAERKILIIDDYPQLVDFLTERLSAEGYEVRNAATGADGLGIVDRGFSGVILLDMRLPDVTGLDLFQKIKAIGPDLPVIFITAHATVDLAVEATRQGAFDFIAKGSDLLKRLSVSVKNAFEKLEMTERLHRLTSQVSNKARFERIVSVGRTSQGLVEVRGALKPGETVATDHLDALTDGAHVSAK